MTGPRTLPAAVEVAFTPALPADKPKKPGTGYLQPGGLVVHTGWGYPGRGEEQILREYLGYEGSQCWRISTPDGHRVSRFSYVSREQAQAAASAIAAALPGGAWPDQSADAGGLRAIALHASATPALLPLTHRGKPNWGSGYGGDQTYFLVPETRAEYERVIAANGRIPAACQACARVVREQKKAGWGPRTNHWPKWSVPGHRGAEVRAHCNCAVCLGLDVRMGTFGSALDDAGNTVPASTAVYPWSAVPGTVGPDVERSDRAFAWFAYFLAEGGCVVMDERPGLNLWPASVRHDDALFCETGVTGIDAVDAEGEEAVEPL